MSNPNERLRHHVTGAIERGEATPIVQQPTPQAFFYEHAGYSYTPGKETEEEGRTRCAFALADAEAWALAEGYSFDWGPCDTDSSDFSDERPFYVLHACYMCDADGSLVQSLHAIAFGRDKPAAGPYRRVVEAELALEQQNAEGHK